MFVILYDEAAEDDLRALRAFEVRRVIDDVDEQLTKTPSTPSRRRKLLEGSFRLGTAFAPFGSFGSETSVSSMTSTRRGRR
jgi:hypothetical protein